MHARTIIGRASVAAVALLFVCMTGAYSQDSLQERIVTAEPFAPMGAGAYQPCSETALEIAGWCLPERLRIADRLKSARFGVEGTICALTYTDQSEPERFVCGDLLLQLRRRTAPDALTEIRVAAGGEWVRIRDSRSGLSARLLVPPGGERSAILGILFHPDVMWVELNHPGRVFVHGSHDLGMN